MLVLIYLTDTLEFDFWMISLIPVTSTWNIRISISTETHLSVSDPCSFFYIGILQIVHLAFVKPGYDIYAHTIKPEYSKKQNPKVHVN